MIVRMSQQSPWQRQRQHVGSTDITEYTLQSIIVNEQLSNFEDMVDLVDSIGRKLERNDNDNSSQRSDTQLPGDPQIAGPLQFVEGPSDCLGPFRLLRAPQIARTPQIAGAPQVDIGPLRLSGPFRLLIATQIAGAPRISGAPQIVGGPSDCRGPFRLLRALGGPSDC